MLDRSSDCVDTHAPDTLSDVLHDVRLSGASYCRTEVSAHWGIAFPTQNRAQFHFIAKGESWLRVGAEAPQRLRAGDLVLFPRGASHHLSDQPHGRTTPIEDLPREQVDATTNRLRNGGGGAPTLLVCCSFGIAEPIVNLLFGMMPAALVVRRAEAQDGALLKLLEIMAEEVASPRLGAATVMARLADVVVTRVIRGWVEAHHTDTCGWLTAIRDPKVGAALAAIHRQPEQAWTVHALAERAALSRSVFSERFTALLGLPPAQYLARWRIELARGLLRDARMTVAEVALRVGYDSEAAFSRAFKRVVGVPPSALRRSD